MGNVADVAFDSESEGARRSEWHQPRKPRGPDTHLPDPSDREQEGRWRGHQDVSVSTSASLRQRTLTQYVHTTTGRRLGASNFITVMGRARLISHSFIARGLT